MRASLICVILLCLSPAGLAARPSDVSRRAQDVMFPVEQPWRALYESFETSVPPPGWTAAIVNSTHTWLQDDYAPYEGDFYASCYFDDTYSGVQDEWLCFDYTIETCDDCLCFYAMGNPYWAVDPFQNYNFMVTIDGVEVWNYHDDNNGALTWQWQPYCVDLGNHDAGTTVSICLGYQGYDGAQASFDAVAIGECPPEPPTPCCPFPTPCHVVDFNVDDGGVYAEPCGERVGLWSWGAAPEAPAVACGGAAVETVLGVALGGPYPEDAGEAAVIGPFAITDDCSCLELCHFYSAEAGYDGGNVKVSDDQGATWTLVHPDLGYDDVLDSGTSQARCVWGEEVFTGDSSGFIRDCFDLSGLIGSDVLVGFFFGSDGYGDESLGWYIQWAKIGGDGTPVRIGSWGTIKAMYR